jgi:hypothetical protein
MRNGPLELALRVAEILEEIGVPYALGGSLASSLLGEPRTTADVDMAIRLPDDTRESAATDLLARLEAQFYVPSESARRSLTEHGSFNLLDTGTTLKVDLFVLGDDLLDRMQIQRRVFIGLGSAQGLWVTSPEDQVLRKLTWFESGGRVSDRQWRDVIGLVEACGGQLDRGYLMDVARRVGLGDLVDEALRGEP